MQKIPIFNPIRHVDPRFRASDFEKAAEIRRAENARLTSEPVFNGIRKTFDTANDICPLKKKHTTTSVQNARRAAMQELRDQLNGIHSKAKSQFEESVPPSSNESRFRAELATDAVNEELMANGSKTSATINVRPLNAEAAKIRRDQFLKDSGIPNITDEGEVSYCGRAIARLRKDIKPEDEELLINLINLIAPWEDDDGSTNDDEKSKKDTPIPKSNEMRAKIETRSDGEKYLTFNAVLRDHGKDVFQQFATTFHRNFLGGYPGDQQEATAKNLAPDLFRLLTLRVDIPHSIGELFKTSETKTWMDLIEGSRVNVQAITRKHFFTKLIGEKFSEGILESFDADDLRQLALLLLGTNIFSDASLRVKQMPPSLAFAMLVNEGGHTCRRTAEASDSFSVSEKEKNACHFMNKFTSCGWENLVASFVGSFLRLGLTNHYIKDRITVISALAAIGAIHEKFNIEEPEQDDIATYVVSHLQETLIRCIDEIESVQAIFNSGEIDAEFTGLDREAWSWLPETRQGMVDAAKPVGLANDDDWEPFDHDQPKLLSDDAVEPDQSFRKNQLKRKIEKLIERLWLGDRSGAYDHEDGSMAIVEAFEPKRNSMFTVCVAGRLSEGDEEWAKLLSLWGVEPIGLKEEENGKKNKNDSDDSSDDYSDDSDDGLGMPSPDEGVARFAYVKRKSDGRVFQFFRPIDDSVYGCVAASFVNSCDALVVLNKMDDIDWLKLKGDSSRSGRRRYSFEVDQDDFTPYIHPPTLFVATKPELKTPVEDITKYRRENDCLFTPSCVRSEVLPTSVEEADKLLDWLVENSENPQRGTEEAVPVQAFDFAIEDPVMLP